MRKEYLHLSVYTCNKCGGPVIVGSVAIRENEISKETEKRTLGTICLSCDDRPSQFFGIKPAREFAPVEWHMITGVPETAMLSERGLVSRD
ncbi:MAG TPA: hypothetical protein VFA68_09165 [Terriglobales bacterium]|nr:hypothetical protein [Terriglobales bacterium]